MKLFSALIGLTLVNLAWQARPAPTAVVDPIDAVDGTQIAADLLPATTARCALLVFFDPSCPFCAKVADAHRAMGGTPIETWWVTDDPLAGGAFRYRLADDAKVLVSRDLFQELQVRGVPAGGWIVDGRLVASGALSGDESPERLAEPCLAAEDASSALAAAVTG